MLGELSVVEQRYLAVRDVLEGARVSDVAIRYGLIVARFTVGWSATPMVVCVLWPTPVRSLTVARIRCLRRWRL